MATKKTTFKITGMSCTSCAATIEKALKQTDGIDKGHVNFATEKATVEYDPKKITENDMVKIVESAGYHVTSTSPSIVK